MKRYDPQAIEPKWQKVWAKSDLWHAPDKPKANAKAYVLDMFPYPSGDGLHLGHIKSYTPSDAYSHFMRYTGHEVLHPIGWDAFGLPAENAAIKKKIHPAENTAKNVENFERQLKSVGISFDWDRVVDTSDPGYYKWTQWIFTRMFEKGLAYQAVGEQWWCPKDKTVLANEQVIDGRCERCGSEVTKKALKQWYFKITDYADELLESIDELDWPEKIKTMQRNWIGRSQGAEVTFTTEASDLVVYTTRPDTLFGATYMVLAPEHELVDALTTKEHAKAVKQYVEQAKKESEIARTATDKEKTGVFTGSYATNPINNEKIPIWIADYVLASYGTGAIMAVPAHDERDHEFAVKYQLPIRQVLEPFYTQTTEPGIVQEDEPYDHRDAIIAVVKHWSEDKYLALKWKQVAWGTFITGGIEKGQTAEQAAIAEIREETGYQNAELVEDFGKVHGLFYHVPKKVNRFAHAQTMLLQLKDDERTDVAKEEQEKHEALWLTLEELEDFLTPATHHHVLRFVRGTQGAHQGEGIMVNSGKYDGLTSSEAREQIVAELEKKKIGKSQTGYKLRDWLISRQRYWGTPIPIIHCKKCGAQAVPEKDLPVELPEIKDYLPTGDGRSPLAKVKSFVETTCPKCKGKAERETDTMDTFADSSWYFLRYPNPKDKKTAWNKENVKAWLPVDTYVGGAEHAVLHLLYARFFTKFLADEKLIGFREPFLSLRNQGLILGPDGAKMSKSKGNVISPDEIVESVGADTLRTYVLFMGPFEQTAAWKKSDMEGVYRFLKRVWAFGQELAEAADKETQTPDAVIDQAALNRAASRATKNVTSSLERFRFNTAVSALMETLNEFTKLKEADGFQLTDEWRTHFEKFLVLLSPFAPHITEELWHELGHKESIFTQSWPKVDESALASDTATIVVQVNGKVRTNLELPVGASEAEAKEAALAEANVRKFVDGKDVKKVIHVPDKLLNLVV